MYNFFNTYKHVGLFKICLVYRRTFAILEIGGKVDSGIFLRHVLLYKVTVKGKMAEKLKVPQPLFAIR